MNRKMPFLSNVQMLRPLFHLVVVAEIVAVDEVVDVAVVVVIVQTSRVEFALIFVTRVCVTVKIAAIVTRQLKPKIKRMQVQMLQNLLMSMNLPLLLLTTIILLDGVLILVLRAICQILKAILFRGCLQTNQFVVHLVARSLLATLVLLLSNCVMVMHREELLLMIRFTQKI